MNTTRDIANYALCIMNYALIATMAIMIVGCDFLDDDRDACPDANTVQFRYVLNGQECFRQYIDRTAYWLFDANGNFIRQMDVDEYKFDQVDICGLKPGKYSIVCVGNLRNYGAAEGFEKEGLEGFRLRVNKFRSEDPEIFDNGEHIFWGETSFEVQPNDVNKFIGYMANIHFGITVKVEWETPPTRAGEFKYELEGVAESTRLNDLESNMVDGHRMPLVENYGRRMMMDVSYRHQSLEAQMLALRIDDDNIPSFCVYEDDKPLMKKLDLQRVFDAYGWSPSSSNFQQYSIKVMIQDNGDVHVSANLSTEISNWEDGGAIGW